MSSRRAHIAERKILHLLFSSGGREKIRLRQEAANLNANYDSTKEGG